MTEQAISYESAESLRKNKQYTQAAQQFAQLWQQYTTKMIGWRYAQCLRKSGQLEKAEQLAREAHEKFPDDEWTAKELFWVIYDKELKPAKEDSDLGRLLYHARQALEFTQDSFAVNRTVLTVIKVAKAKGKWEVVLEWADKAQPNELNTVPPTNVRGGMSDKEVWYVNRSRALYEIGRFEESRIFANQGLQEFPNEVFLARTAALALAETGNLEQPVEELRALLKHPKADWYFKTDLADLEMRTGNIEEAYRLVCEALLASRQGHEYRLGAFRTLTALALELDKLDVAIAHIELTKMIRSQEGWKTHEELLKLESKANAMIKAKDWEKPSLPANVQQLGQICRRYWQAGVKIGITRYRGTLKYNAEKSFAFITREDGGEDVFVLVKELPASCKKDGARVEFSLESSFDRKKQRDSVIATHVECIPE